MNEILPLVSVVIPVYNNETYIEPCICSVINQSYRNLEIIVVNDGSQDNSYNIIHKYMLIDPRITCINQQNAGTNIARKVGLDAAKGKYIQYLDGDDALLPDALEHLVKRAEATSADIVSAPFIFCYQDGRKKHSPILLEDELSGFDYFRKVFEWKGATWNMWGNFQKRSLAYDYDIEILSNVPYGQDATWMIQIFFGNPRIVTLKTPILIYNQNSLSVSYNKAAAGKRYKGSRTLYHWFQDFIEKKGMQQEFNKELAILQMNMTFICIHALCFKSVREDMRNLQANLRLYPDLINRSSKTEQSFVLAFKKSYLLGYLCLTCYKLKNYF